jgi:RNA polymerase sigma-70 factor (ECF subfamily)
VNKRAENASISGDDSDRRNGRQARRQARAEQREEDRLLVERARGGDQTAFRELFDRYHRRAYSLAYGMVHNSDDALDIVQDGFIKAHRYLDRFEGSSSFYTWFYRIVMNLSIDHIRKRKRARHVDFNDALSHESDGPVGEDSLLPRILGQNPGKSLARKEVREQVAAALEELSENHRSVLVMREFEGLSYQEMAEVMNCSKGTIMSRLFHARKNMQKRLLEYMGGEKDFEVE